MESARELVLSRGFGSTTLDAVLEAAGASKGGFFHHFSSKADLGRALVEEYARQDADTLELFMKRAEAGSDDPAQQLVDFVRAFEEIDPAEVQAQPGCLFVSFIYEQDLTTAEIAEVMRDSIELWRNRLLEKLEAAAASRPGIPPIDLGTLADHFFTVVEGALLLSRATQDPGAVQAQLSHLRHYFELLFGLNSGSYGRDT